MVAGLVAVPPESVTADPIFTPSALNCTVPLGVPVEDGELSPTVAVNVTDAPAQDGFAEAETTVVEVLAFVTVSVPLA